MLSAEVPQTLQDVGVIAGVILAVGGALGLVGRSRPGRWLWRNLVSDPFSDYLRTHIDDSLGPIRYELEANDGGSLKDAVRRVEHNQSELLGQFREFSGNGTHEKAKADQE